MHLVGFLGEVQMQVGQLTFRCHYVNIPAMDLTFTYLGLQVSGIGTLIISD